MRIVIFSDLHLHSWKLEPGEWASKKLAAQEAALTKLLAYLNCGYKPDMVVFCGDFYHAHGMASADVSTVAWRFMHQLKATQIPTYMLVGNHDRPYKTHTVHGMEWMRDYATVVTPEMLLKVTEKGRSFTFLSYTDDKELLEQAFADNEPGELVFLHQGVAGVPIGSGRVLDEIFDPAIIPSDVGHVFTGHYHTHQRLNNLTVVGPLMQLTWADSGKVCGWLEYDTETGALIQVDSEAPRYIVCSKPEEVQQVRPGDLVRLSFAQAEEHIAELQKEGVHVEYLPVDEERSSYGTMGVTSLEDILRQYETGLSEERIAIGRMLRQ